MFYHFRQNNSGGYFVIGENVNVHVFVEASTPRLANERAEQVGIYFDGVSAGVDCECCGNRWYRIYEGENCEQGEQTLCIYGEPIEVVSDETIIYMADGRVLRGGSRVSQEAPNAWARLIEESDD